MFMDCSFVLPGFLLKPRLGASLQAGPVARGRAVLAPPGGGGRLVCSGPRPRSPRFGSLALAQGSNASGCGEWLEGPRVWLPLTSWPEGVASPSARHPGHWEWGGAQDLPP